LLHRTCTFSHMVHFLSHMYICYIYVLRWARNAERLSSKLRNKTRV
jgi:hypothetical protein